jgi:hypothetical protein
VFPTPQASNRRRNTQTGCAEKLLGTANNDDTPVRDPLRSLGNARRAATALISCGVGLVILGLLLTGKRFRWIDSSRVRDALRGLAEPLIVDLCRPPIEFEQF